MVDALLADGNSGPTEISFCGFIAKPLKRTFEVWKNGELVYSVKIPKKLMKLYMDIPYRNMVVLDYLDRISAPSPSELSIEDFLKKLAVELNRASRGLLSLESLSKDKVVLSGVHFSYEKHGNLSYIVVSSSSGIKRYFPLDLELIVKLISPLMLLKAVIDKNRKGCCGKKITK